MDFPLSLFSGFGARLAPKPRREFLRGQNASAGLPRATIPSAAKTRIPAFLLALLFGLFSLSAPEVWAAKVTVLDSGLNSGASAILSNDPLRTYTGSGFNLGTAAGISNIPIKGGKLYLASATAQSYTNLRATLYFWGGVTGDTTTTDPAFTNFLGSYSQDYGPQNLNRAVYTFDFVMPSPIVVPTGTLGVTINWKGDTGSGLGDRDDLISFARYGPAMPVGSPAVGSSPDYGFYNNRYGDTDGNFQGRGFILPSGLTNTVMAIDLYVSVPADPLVTTGVADDLTTTGATIRATINPNGAATTAKFEYGLTTAYGNESTITLAPDDDNEDHAVSLSLTGLKPHTTYHYRATAINDQGTSDGMDGTFTTLNSTPTNISLSNNTINENAGAKAVVGLLSATDADAGETFTYTLPVGVDDNAAFNINANQLRASSTYDVDTKSNYLVTVRVTDGGGATFDKQFSITVTEGVKPTVLIGTPTLNQKVVIANFVSGFVSGTAADNSGVSAVKLVLSRKRGTTNTYWNGTDFVSQANVSVNANVMGTTNATWSWINQVPAAAKLDAGAYILTANAFDSFGNKMSLSQPFTLVVDSVAPSVSISTPTSSQVVNINAFSPGTLSGTASDDNGVSAVKVKLQRKRGTVTEYWNGTDFTTTVTLVPATVVPDTGTSVTWQLDQAIPASKLDKGGYTAYATAYDASGNHKTSASRLFSINGIVAAPESAASADSPSAADS